MKPGLRLVENSFDDMKKLLILIPLLTVAAVAIPKTFKVKSFTLSEVLAEDMFQDLPDGISRKQYFRVIDQHVIQYEFQGETLFVTNQIWKGKKLVRKDFININGRYIEKPE
jgi:hypothetical protein